MFRIIRRWALFSALIALLAVALPAGKRVSVNAQAVSTINTSISIARPSAGIGPQTIPGFLNAAGNVTVAYHGETGKLSFVGAEAGAFIPQPIPLLRDATADEAARSFLSVYGNLFGISNPSNELALMKVDSAPGGRSFVRYQQIYKGVPVLGGELIVQLDENMQVLSVNGEALPDLDLLSKTPLVSVERARQAAMQSVSKIYQLPLEKLNTSLPGMWIYNPTLLGGPGVRRNSLVWRLEVTPRDLRPIRQLVLVDALTGAIVLTFNQVDEALSRIIYDNENNPSISLPGTGPVRTEGGPATNVPDADLAYEYSKFAYDYYLSNFGRDSLDGHGLPLVSTVRYCDPDTLAYPCPWENAFWTGDQAVFGQGYAVADDIVAHELTHGVTQYTSNLFYYMQSGAINESFSDIWGELIDLTYTSTLGNDSPSVRWLLGEDLPSGAKRSMSNPPAFNHPDRMGSAYYVCSGGDNGGVHENSGVGNKAAFLMTDGGTFNGITITGLGTNKVSKIYYEAQTHLLTSAADYQDLAMALGQSCNDLVGTSGITLDDCNQVRKAAAAVEMTSQPASCAAVDAPVCDTYGFDSQFNAAMPGWTAVSGAWDVDADAAFTSGIAGNFASLRYSDTYGDFKFETRMRRSGCDTCENGIVIRGSPLPLQPNNRWSKGYAFLYKRDGSVAVMRYSGASITELMAWTSNGAVNPGDNWNNLKVVSKGNLFTFYVNDRLVWSGTDSLFPNGYVGLVMYRDASSPGNLLQVDWAALSGGTPINLFYDGFEGDLGNWTHTSFVGSDAWLQDWGYARTGNTMLHGLDLDGVSDSVARMKEGIALPIPSTAYLRFEHAYGFEFFGSAFIDGGVIEYSKDGGNTWQDASSLILENGYSGTLALHLGNPLEGHRAFVGESGGYISTRLNLDSLKGNTVAFRFRIGTDDSTFDWHAGWNIDDVQIYTCALENHQVFVPSILENAPTR